MAKCKYCGKETKNVIKCICDNCGGKKETADRFVKARDDLREKLGLGRLGAK